jgi:hypothetical protein
MAKYGRSRKWTSQSPHQRGLVDAQTNPRSKIDIGQTEAERLSVDIREILYIPSPLTWNVCDTFQHVTDDDHFCSLLNDKGYIVHVINSMDSSVATSNKNGQSWQKTLSDVIHEFIAERFRKSGLNPSKQLGILCQELSVFPLLSHLVRANKVIF